MLLGEAVTAATIAAAPVTVRVSLPPELDPVLLWPLELPLAGRGDVTFVYGIAPAAGGAKAAVSGALRVLAVFSQPTETSVLALRRERYELTRLIRRIVARQRAAVELKVVQYGVTRELLAEIAGSGMAGTCCTCPVMAAVACSCLSRLTAPRIRWVRPRWSGCCARCGGA